MIIKAFTLALAMSASYAAGNGMHSASAELATWLAASSAHSASYAPVDR